MAEQMLDVIFHCWRTPIDSNRPSLDSRHDHLIQISLMIHNMSSVSLRSTHGCWTCRVRRKKCDETHPICEACQSLHITCYGYSSDRPEWMDNGNAEKAMIDNLKRSVRLSTRRRKIFQTKTPLQSFSPASTHFLLSSLPDDHSRKHQCGVSNTSTVIDKPALGGFSINHERDPGLIMHFFDHVFPLQHPAYRPLIEEGGRGWYLSLIFSSRALYHATLCLSAYHREVTTRRLGSSCHELNLQDLEMHNALSFKVLQQQLGENAKSMSIRQRIGMLAGIVQMMFFQVSIDLDLPSIFISCLHANQPEASFY